jgi:hypothetical protein
MSGFRVFDLLDHELAGGRFVIGLTIPYTNVTIASGSREEATEIALKAWFEIQYFVDRVVARPG